MHHTLLRLILIFLMHPHLNLFSNSQSLIIFFLSRHLKLLNNLPILLNNPFTFILQPCCFFIIRCCLFIKFHCIGTNKSKISLQFIRRFNISIFQHFLKHILETHRDFNKVRITLNKVFNRIEEIVVGVKKGKLFYQGFEGLVSLLLSTFWTVVSFVALSFVFVELGVAEFTIASFMNPHPTLRTLNHRLLIILLITPNPFTNRTILLLTPLLITSGAHLIILRPFIALRLSRRSPITPFTFNTQFTFPFNLFSKITKITPKGRDLILYITFYTTVMEYCVARFTF